MVFQRETTQIEPLAFFFGFSMMFMGVKEQILEIII